MTQKYTGRARNLLKLDRVAEFAAWLAVQRWVREQTSSQDEILRMRSPAGELAIVTMRPGAKVHATVSGIALELAQRFVVERRAYQEPGRNPAKNTAGFFQEDES